MVTFDNIMKLLVENGEAKVFGGVVWEIKRKGEVECGQALDGSYVRLADPTSISILEKAYENCLKEEVNEEVGCPLCKPRDGNRPGCWRRNTCYPIGSFPMSYPKERIDE